jgi:hypothetical protein
MDVVFCSVSLIFYSVSIVWRGQSNFLRFPLYSTTVSAGIGTADGLERGRIEFPGT